MPRAAKNYYIIGSLDYMDVHVRREMHVYTGSRYRRFTCTLYINLTSKLKILQIIMWNIGMA